MFQWFSGIPIDTMSLEVKPKENVSLKRAVYRGNMPSLRNGEYTASDPFLCGTMLRADFYGEYDRPKRSSRYKAEIGVKFTAIQHDPIGGYNYLADSVIVPGVLLPEKVDISVVDTPAERNR